MAAIAFEFPSPAIPFVVAVAEVEGLERPIRVLFDTGNATPFAVVIAQSSPLAARAKPTGARAHVALGAVGGSVPTFTPSRLAGLRLGPVVLNDMSAGVSASIDTVAAQLPGGIDAVVGQTLVRDRVVRVDYRTRELDLDAKPGATDRAVPMQLAPVRALSLIDVRINGRGPFRMAVDTAAGGTLISPQAAQRAGVPADGQEVRLGGAGGTGSIGHMAAAAVAAGERRWPQAQVIVTDVVGMIAEGAGAPLDGVLGANLLVGGAITLDYPGGRAWIEPAE